jgi:hypothetical protein
VRDSFLTLRYGLAVFLVLWSSGVCSVGRVSGKRARNDRSERVGTRLPRARQGPAGEIEERVRQRDRGIVDVLTAVLAQGSEREVSRQS